MTAAGQTSTRPRLPVWRMMALRAALWMLVAAGPLGAAAVWTQLESIDGQLQALADQTSSAQVADTAEVAGVAELAVADFLAGTVTPEESMVLTTVSLGVEEIDVDYWAVTIAAARVGTDTEGVVRFYLVAVVENGSSWAVVGPPALVAGPVAAETPDVAVAMSGIDDAGLEEATDGFLAAYLTGDGDVTRYTAPGSQLRPVTPAPFVVVEILDAGSTSRGPGEQVVVVAVKATDPAGAVQALRYSIVLADRGGRWEVTELLPAPPLEERGSDD